MPLFWPSIGRTKSTSGACKTPTPARVSAERWTNMPEAVETWVAQMSQRFAGRPIAVAVEQSRGALVFLLSKYEQLHIEGLACVVFAGGVRCPDNPGQQKDHSNLYTALGKVSLELL